MRLITALELLFWFLAMITRICFKFEGKEKVNCKIEPKTKTRSNDLQRGQSENKSRLEREKQDDIVLIRQLQSRINALEASMKNLK